MEETGIKILLIEDDEDDALIIREMLIQRGAAAQVFELAHANRLQKGLDLLSRGGIDVVLSDLTLPDSQGVETVVKVQRQNPAVPVIALTGHSDEELAIEGIRGGAQDYLVKGRIDRNLLTRSIRYAIERKKLDRMKKEFISTVNHELRTPLTSIRGSLVLIDTGMAGQLPPDAHTLLKIAINNCERLVRLINDILDIEKMESGRMDLKLKAAVLVPLIEQAVEANRDYGKQFGVQFRLDQPLHNAMVLVDSDAFMQIMTNLLSNATKFSSAGDSVVVSASPSRDGVRIAVTDHGPGIPEEFQNRIFGKFAQADASDSRKKGGTGLGLSIVKGLVERLGGKVGFETKAGKGTTFYFHLKEGGTTNAGNA